MRATASFTGDERPGGAVVGLVGERFAPVFLRTITMGFVLRDSLRVGFTFALPSGRSVCCYRYLSDGFSASPLQPDPKEGCFLYRFGTRRLSFAFELPFPG